MRDISKEFPGVKALSNVSMTVRRGEIHAICGENGAGKSTLMKVLSGVWPAGTYDGEIHFNGQLVEFNNIRDSEHAGIVIIHQELALIPELSIGENIFLGNEVANGGVINWMTTRQRASELLARVGLNENPDTKIKDIGVGKQQLVEIAKALSKEVKLLILDEPTSALNEGDSQHLLGLMSGLREQRRDLHHDQPQAQRDRADLRLDHDHPRRQVHRDPPGQGGRGRREPHHPRHGRPGHRVPVPRPRPGDRRDAVRGQELDRAAPERRGPAGLQERELLRPPRRDRRVRRPDGRGTHRADAQHLRRSPTASSSAARCSRRARSSSSSRCPAAIDAGLAYVTEDRKTLGLNLLDDIKRTTVSAKLKRITHGLVVDEREEYKFAEEYRKSMRTKAPTVDEGVSKLSGGNQQKVVLAKWLFTEPDLLILDEPTRGIDVGAKFEIYGIVQRMAAEGKGVILVSSELPELLGLSDRIYTICEGAITGVLDKGHADQESLMRLMTKTSSRSDVPTQASA